MTLAGLDFPGSDRFLIRRRLGTGTVGVVFEAEDRERGEIVALKALRDTDPAEIYRLKKEFRTLADVAHPSLVSLYELFANDDAWFFTMELIEGTDFLSYVRGAEGGATGTLDENRLRAALKQLTAGVVALHRAGHLHRDLKPSNVMVTPSGRLVILDFGISAELRQPLDPRVQTVEMGIWGTPIYMAPEQFLGETATRASDWYAVGVMLYEALTGQPPFSGRLGEIMMAKTSRPPEHPKNLTPDCPQDLADLAMAMLAAEPERRPADDQIVRTLAPESSSGTQLHREESGIVSALIGREKQLAALESAFADSLGGSSVSMYVRGASGIGKSTLIQSFLDRMARRKDTVVLSGRCYVRESLPHKALDAIVDSLSRYLRTLTPNEIEPLIPDQVAALLRTFPVLQRVDALSAAAREWHSYDAIEMRRSAFRALRELLARIAQTRALVLAIDDLQWADEPSVQALEDLMSAADAPGALLLASFRSEEIASHSVLQAAVDRAESLSTRHLVLEPLTHDEIVSLVRQLSGGADETMLTSNLVEEIAAESTGSPFLAEQLTRYVLAGGSSRMGRVNLAEMLEARIAQLHTDARALLLTLAVAARPLGDDVVRDAAGVASSMNALVNALVAEHLVRTSVSARRVELYHDRIRETLSAQISDQDRRQTHLRLARALERHDIDDAEALFEHYLGAGHVAEAATYAARAARNAVATLAFDRAVMLYKRALQITSASDSRLGDLRAELAEALTNSGRMGEAALAFEAAADANPENALEYHRRAAEQFLMGGHTDAGLEVLRRVLDSVGLKMPETPMRAAFQYLRLRLRLAVRGLGYVRRSADQVPIDELRRIDICWAGAAGLSLSEPLRGVYFQTLYILLALRAGEPHRIARAYAVETGFSAAGGGRTRQRTVRWKQRAAELAADLGDKQAFARNVMTEGVAAFLVGEWARAASLCERAEELLLENPIGMMWELATARNFWVSSRTYLGDIPVLARRVPALMKDARERGNQYFWTQLRIRGIILSLARDEPNRGGAEVDEAIAGWSTSTYFIQHFNGMHARVQVDLYQNEARSAWRRIEASWRPLRQSLLLRVQMLRVEAMFLRGRAALLCAATGHERESMLEDAERSAKDIDRQRLMWTAPLASLLRASCAALRGNEVRARQQLRMANRGFDNADMLLLGYATKRRLGQLTGGSEGEGLIATADGGLRSHGVVNPERLTAVLAPGFIRS